LGLSAAYLFLDVESLDTPLFKHTILFLAANPLDTDRLALDREAREIQLELALSGCRDQFEFVTRWAAEPLDLLRELRKLKPTVVHFSGRGRGRGGGHSNKPSDSMGHLMLQTEICNRNYSFKGLTADLGLSRLLRSEKPSQQLATQ
jgi:hypothetical protein